MKTTIKLLILLFAGSLFGADAANDLLLTQRNSGNTGNIQRNITATTNTLLGWNGTTLQNITAGSNITILAGVISATGGGGGTPGGSSGDWQYNNAGAFGGRAPATGWNTLFATPTSANVRGWITDESGTGALLFADGNGGNFTVGTLTRTGTATNNVVLGVVSDATTYNLLTFNNVSSGAGSLGISGGGGSDKTLYLRVPTAGTFDFKINNTSVGLLTSTGLNATPIGATTPASVVGTTFNSSTDANRRTSKTNFNVPLNIMDYGAIPNDGLDDTTAINDAITAAMAAGTGVRIPGGVFSTTGITITGATGFSLIGDGMGVSVLKTLTPSRVLIFVGGDHVTVSGITFDGSCTTRTAGQQAVVADTNSFTFTHNEIINSGEFAIMVGQAGGNSDLSITNNLIGLNYADGINLQNITGGLVANNIINGADDDCIAVGSCAYVDVIGNYCKSRNDLGTTWGRGILVARGNDVLISGNYITAIKQTGIYISSEGGVARVGRASVIGNTVYACAIASGHGIEVNGANESELIDNKVIDPAQGSCIEIADWSNLTIRGGVLTQTINTFGRGIHTNESSGTFQFTTWRKLVIKDVVINMTGAATDMSIYLSPHSSITMETGIVDNNVCNQVLAGDYVYVNSARTSTLWKIVNNSYIGTGSTVNPASTTGIFTVVNNN